jgi:ankyrin
VYTVAIVVALLALSACAFLLWRWRVGAAKETLPEAVMQQHGSLIMRRLKKGANPDTIDDLGYTAAIYAAGQGDVGVLKELAGYGANLGLQTGQGETPLYSAAQHGQLQSVLYLLRQGVPVDPETVHRETPLLIAAREGQVSIVRALLAAGANVNQQDNRGWSALMIAMRENQKELTDLLLNHNVNVNIAPKDGANALMMAVKKEDEDLVRRLLDRGADVHHLSRDGMCALRIAVLRGNQPIARRLLNAGANVSAPFANKETPVEVAEREGHKELAAYLRKREARLAACMDILEVVARGDHERVKEIVAQVPRSINVHSARSRWTPLLIAVRAGQLEIAVTLLEHGADVHARSQDGKSAIAFAVDAGDLAMVKALLEGGARIDQIDAEGTDLRTYAEAQNQPGTVEFVDSFVRQQAAGFNLFQAVTEDDPPRALTLLREDPGCVDARTRHERWTPLMQAVRDDNVPMARLLMEYKAQVNLTNSRGMTALMYASRNGNLELVRMLVNAGADVRIRSRDGNTACEFALDKGHARVVMLLQEVEAQLSDWSKMGLLTEAETRFDGPPPANDSDHGRSDDIFKAIQENDIRLAKQVLHYWPDCVRLRRGPSELTPLHMAINGGNQDMAQLLVGAGADVNAKSREGKTPLYQAVARADANLTTMLLRNGAQVWQLVQGQTALQVAQAAGYTDIVAELNRNTSTDS